MAMFSMATESEAGEFYGIGDWSPDVIETKQHGGQIYAAIIVG